MTDSISVRITPLARGSNWRQWSAQLRAMLTTKDRYDKLLDAPPQSGEEEKDVICKAKIQLHVSGALHSVVERASSAHEAWEALRKEYLGDQKARQPILINKLMELRQGRDSVIAYIDKTHELRDQMESLEMDSAISLLCRDRIK